MHCHALNNSAHTFTRTGEQIISIQCLIHSKTLSLIFLICRRDISIKWRVKLTQKTKLIVNEKVHCQSRAHHNFLLQNAHASKPKRTVQKWSHNRIRKHRLIKFPRSSRRESNYKSTGHRQSKFDSMFFFLKKILSIEKAGKSIPFAFARKEKNRTHNRHERREVWCKRTSSYAICSSVSCWMVIVIEHSFYWFICRAKFHLCSSKERKYIW